MQSRLLSSRQMLDPRNDPGIFAGGQHVDRFASVQFGAAIGADVSQPSHRQFFPGGLWRPRSLLCSSLARFRTQRSRRGGSWTRTGCVSRTQRAEGLPTRQQQAHHGSTTATGPSTATHVPGLAWLRDRRRQRRPHFAAMHTEPDGQRPNTQTFVTLRETNLLIQLHLEQSTFPSPQHSPAARTTVRTKGLKVGPK